MSDTFRLQNVLAVGVDPHRESLDLIGIRFPEEILLDKTFENTRADHRALLSEARELARQEGLTLVFGLEDSGNYGYTLARYLADQGCCIKEVNPRMTSRQRDFYGQDKTDRLDALAAAAVILRAYDRLPDVTVIQEATEATQKLSRYREQLVKEQTANLNRLHRQLANQYPTYKEFFSRINGVTALHFWATYPTPSHLREVDEDELAEFLYDKSNQRLGQKGSQTKARQILEQASGPHLPYPGLVVEADAQVISDLSLRLLQLKRSIQTTESALEGAIAATGQQLQSFNGLGTALAGVFIGEMRNTAQFDQDNDKFASYNGTAPATKGSGKHTRHVENRWCNRRLKNAFDQLALTAREREPLSREYYECCLNRGLDKQEAHKRLMRRLSDIIFAMMRDKTPYDPEIHRRKQAQRGKKKGGSVAAAGQRQEPFAFPPPRDVTISRVGKSVKQREHELVPV
jgi:transposase